MPRRPPNKIRLNELALKRLKPKDRPYPVWDAQQHGLAIPVSPGYTRGPGRTNPSDHAATIGRGVV
jgi:hypothetical protein